MTTAFHSLPIFDIFQKLEESPFFPPIIPIFREKEKKEKAETREESSLYRIWKRFQIPLSSYRKTHRTWMVPIFVSRIFGRRSDTGRERRKSRKDPRFLVPPPLGWRRKREGRRFVVRSDGKRQTERLGFRQPLVKGPRTAAGRRRKLAPLFLP